MKPRQYVIGLAALMLLGSIPLMVPADTAIDSVSIATSDSNADGKPDSASVTVLVDNHNTAAPPNNITVNAKLFPPGKPADPASADFISSDQKTVNNPAPMALSPFVLNLAATAHSGIGSYTVLIEESNDDASGYNYTTTTRSVLLYQLDLNATFLVSADRAEQAVGLGQNTTFNFTVWNRGAQPENYSISSPGVDLPWQASRDCSTLAINGGDNATFTVKVLAPGTYSLVNPLYADVTVWVRSDSTSEQTNCTVRVSYGLAELIIREADLSISDENPVACSTVVVSARVHNNGPVPASNITVDLDVGYVNVLSANIPYLAAGGSSTVVSFNWTVTPGPKSLKVIANRGQSIPELTYANNMWLLNVWARSAELSADPLVFSAYPPNLQVGTAATLSFVVYNQGTLDAGAFTVRMTIGNFTQDQIVPGLLINGSAVVNFTYTVAQSVQTVQIDIDPADAVPEYFMTYHNLNFTLRANQRPVAVFQLTPASAEVRSTVSFRTFGTLDNDGSIASYHFDFGDHNSYNGTAGTNITHYYTQTGQYIVTLVVTDNEGAQSLPVTQMVTVVARTTPAPFLPGFELVAALAAAGVVSVLAGQRKRK